MNKVFSYVAIPTDDFDRAYQFYETITAGLIYRNVNVPFPMAYFVDEDKIIPVTSLSCPVLSLRPMGQSCTWNWPMILMKRYQRL